MAWIESHQAVERHPKTLHLAASMGWDLDTTVGKLHRFWWWCVDYAEDGNLEKHNDSILGAAVALNGDLASKFVKAMKTARWLDSEPYFRVHDWWFYIGRFLQVKYKTNHPERWQAVREAYIGSCVEPPKNGSKNGLKTRNQPTNQPKPTNQPNGADPPGFLAWWKLWPPHERKDGRAKCLKAWISANLEPKSIEIIACLDRFKKSRDWTKRDGEFIPKPMTWLNATPWETDPDEQQVGDKNETGDIFAGLEATK